MSIHHRHGWLFAVLLAISGHAAALCPVSGFYRYVGDTASDGQCTDNDIQTAINNASTTCRTNIVITAEHTYTTQALEISNKTISLQGAANGAPCNFKPPVCDPGVGCGVGGGTTGPAIILHGNGSASVLYVHGNSNVTLQSLELTGGGGIDYGGGVHFSGTGSLTLVDSTITNNSATYGGGIQFNGSGGNATLTLGADTILDENTASTDGGGIQINGTARLFALASNIFIGYNHAPNGTGGGVAVVGPAGASIGSAGYNTGPVLQFNDAAYGGGISVVGGPDNGLDAFAQFFTVDPSNPVQISDNTAALKGGALYTKGFISNVLGKIAQATANVYLCEFRMNDNVAADGAAIYQDWDSSIGLGSEGTEVSLNQIVACGTDAQGTPIGVACAAGVPCNEISGNAAQNSSSQPTGGSTMLVGQESDLYVRRVAIRGNLAGYAVNAVGDFNTVYLINSLVADNHTQHELFGARSTNLAEVLVDSCTIAHNTIDNGYVLYGNGNTTLQLTNSIIDMPGVSTLDYTGSAANLTVQYVVASDGATLPAALGVIQAEPTFVDVAAGDYHLVPTSIGIDYAPATGGVDLDGNPRDVDLAPIPNNFGPRDIGAYERQNMFQCGTANSIFCNSFDHSW
jgi:predicted outer membrane repeat protein